MSTTLDRARRRHNRQDWSVGKTVRVGFLELVVLATVPTPGDFQPDAYVLTGRGGQTYSFVPHRGLHKHPSVEEAAAWLRS